MFIVLLLTFLQVSAEGVIDTPDAPIEDARGMFAVALGLYVGAALFYLGEDFKRNLVAFTPGTFFLICGLLLYLFG